ncbi:MAG: asparagine synthetase B [Cyclobacteriaceae bacterium]|nr:asparagine synthetase B [Cyclobacteriaceae bacterium]
MMRKILAILILGLATPAEAVSILIPMDGAQRNHLKAYGLVYSILKGDESVDWLLNYRGGSFLTTYTKTAESECVVRGISYEVLSAEKVNAIIQDVSRPQANMNLVRLERAAKIGVYSPKNELIDDETDAVISVLDYAEIPYKIIYDEEILHDSLGRYEWIHLHHEDFTGQHGRFMRRESAVMQAKLQEITASQFGYAKVSQMKLDVAKRIKAYCLNGGYLFAMCSGAETIDIALAANGVDISGSSYDGDDADPEAQEKLDFTQTMAFENFTLEYAGRKFSDINSGSGRPNFWETPSSYFRLFDYSAKWDIIPSMLTQNHEHVIREFYGQTTCFNKYLIKPRVQILGESTQENKVRYIYDELGKGHWTFYSGHDPEGSPGPGRRTDLNLHPHSPGYRLILNNVLFPSARKKKQKT